MRRSVARVASGLVFPLLLVACGVDGGAGVGEPEGSASGRLVIIGGGLQAENTAVYQAVLDGRNGEGPLCVFPTASADPEGSMESAIGRFDAVGGPGIAVGIWITVDNPEAASDPATVEQIEACSGFYFVGGQQSRIVRVFRPDEGDTPAYGALMDRYAAGAVASGSSAGAAIMNDPMINGGNSEGALTAGVRAEGGSEGVILAKGMGFLAGTFVDQHSLARGRWARLLVAVLASHGYGLAMGIDENTAVVVDADRARVVGTSGVTYFDTRGVVGDPAGHAGSGIVVHLLGSGDEVDLQTGEVQLQAGKADLPGTGEPYLDSEGDLFARWALLHFFSESAMSSDTLFVFEQAGFRFEFSKGPDFRARALEGLGTQDTPLGLSAGPYLLSVEAAHDN